MEEYGSNHFLTKSAISPEKSITLLSFFAKLLPHGFDGLTKVIDFSLPILLLLEQFVALPCESVEDVLFETNFFWGIVVIFENESVKIRLRIEMVKRNGGERRRHRRIRRLWSKLRPKVDNLVGSSLTLFETCSVLFGTAGKLCSDSRYIRRGDIDNLFGRVGDRNIEEAVLQVRRIDSQCIM